MRSHTSSLPRAVLALLAFCAGTAWAAADHAHHNHTQPATPAKATSSATAAPSLEFVLPQTGATVGSQLAVVFKTDAVIEKVTMGASQPGIHLHIDTAGVSVMPAAEQLIRLGGGHYVFVFEVPLTPGDRTLRLSWADAQHRTMAATVREVKVRVAKGGAATP